MFLFNLLVDLLPAKLQGAAKAVYPAVATIVATAAQWVSTGTFDTGEFATAISGGVLALLVYLLPNKHAVPQS